VFSELKKGRQKVQFGSLSTDVTSIDDKDGTEASCQSAVLKQV